MPGVGFGPWQLLTYGFLHGNWSHILFDMLALFMFGAPLEYTWGPRRYLTYYLTAVAGAGLCQLLVTSWMAASIRSQMACERRTVMSPSTTR